MKTTARSFLSSSIALGLIAFTAVSAFAFGTVATVTLLGFSAVVLHGILNIAVLSYAPAPYVKTSRPGSTVRGNRKAVASIVAFPQAACCRSAA